MLHLLEQLRDKYQDIRGELSNETEIRLKELKKQILENTEMEAIANSSAGKKLISNTISFIEKIDNICMDEQVKGEIKLDLLKQRKAWVETLRVLLGGKSQLEAINKQIKTYLQTED